MLFKYAPVIYDKKIVFVYLSLLEKGVAKFGLSQTDFLICTFPSSWIRPPIVNCLYIPVRFLIVYYKRVLYCVCVFWYFDFSMILTYSWYKSVRKSLYYQKVIRYIKFEGKKRWNSKKREADHNFLVYTCAMDSWTVHSTMISIWMRLVFAERFLIV